MRFLLWHLGTIVVCTVMYFIWTAANFGKAQGIYCALLCATVFTMFSVGYSKKENLITVETDEEKRPLRTLVSLVAFAAVAYLVADYCGFSTAEQSILFAVVVVSTVTVPFEAVVVLVLFIIVFLIAFGVERHARLVVLLGAIAMGFVHTERERKNRLGLIIVGASITTTIISLVFHYGPNIFSLRLFR